MFRTVTSVTGRFRAPVYNSKEDGSKKRHLPAGTERYGQPAGITLQCFRERVNVMR